MAGQFERGDVEALIICLDENLANLNKEIAEFKDKVSILLDSEKYNGVEYEDIVALLRHHEEIDGCGNDSLLHKVHSDIYDIRTNLIHLFRSYAEANVTAK